MEEPVRFNQIVALGDDATQRFEPDKGSRWATMSCIGTRFLAALITIAFAHHPEISLTRCAARSFSAVAGVRPGPGSLTARR